MSFFYELIQALQELLFPAHCLGCEEQFMQLASCRPPLLCPNCRRNVAVATICPPFCIRCGIPLVVGDNHLCLSCLDNSLACITKVRSVRSSFLYQEPISALVRQLKFTGNLTGLATLATLARQTSSLMDLNEPDLILPVPLHLQRLRERGFNQSLLLARACFPQWRKKIRFDLLQRQRATVPQTRLNGKARQTNLQQAFCMKTPQSLDVVQGKNILLVDDVFTTGSTLYECAKVLLEAGAGAIDAFTVARSAGLSINSGHPDNI
ncbi:MAG: ComF family protein [Candidatus Electrothrix sp. AU1_5]|nr:ComF family protein [Candidatus Electrothrix gigas]